MASKREMPSNTLLFLLLATQIASKGDWKVWSGNDFIGKWERDWKGDFPEQLIKIIDGIGVIYK